MTCYERMEYFYNSALELYNEEKYLPHAVSRMYYAVFHCIQWRLEFVGVKKSNRHKKAREDFCNKIEHPNDIDLDKLNSLVLSFQVLREKADYSTSFDMVRGAGRVLIIGFEEMKVFIKQQQGQQSLTKSSVFA